MIKVCPNCGSGIIVTNHTVLSICPNCKACVEPKESK
jgi:ribosomal protein S27AE